MEELKQRFLEKVGKTETCWLWKAATRGNRNDPYGAFKFGDKVIDAHRVSYFLFKGEIPEEMHVCHSCDIRLCVNPDHLWLGTRSDNMKDCSKKGRLFISQSFLNKGFKKGNQLSERKLSTAQAKEIKDLIKSKKLKLKDIAQRFLVKESVIRDISAGRTYINI